MRIGYNGRLVDEPCIRAGFIGCGSHSFRNVYPALQFAPVELVAVCDLDLARAQAFARQFGAERAYDDHARMLRDERLDAVFIVTGYDKDGRPLYPGLARDCMGAGCHVWMEKPPAATCGEIERLMALSRQSGRTVMTGLKKMFFPANRKARSLLDAGEIGQARLVTIQYPQFVPPADDLRRYLGERQNVPAAVGFLDHLCHPAAVLLLLLGMPRSLYYERSSHGAGIATFTFASGAVASMVLSRGQGPNGGMERTEVITDAGHRIVVDNNTRVTLYRPMRLGYGTSPDFYATPSDQAALTWEPEFSLGQLYNKGLFLLGYAGEVNEFARAVLERRPPIAGTLEHAWQVTRLFQAFAEGPGKVIEVPAGPADEG